ncbi:hypothetical protein GSI_04203 [Ganoderma sinense ZZ0214-1]|uniref:Uncharacterized protein n=1 Tax=Ganoderma sinense ZZ0214-1 TaxID=1077348 RepID=A0A2G8SIK0_9APHY|nr:hypothetical protein GSI_04203 [Ganoderma sinense ZZ0214-1]
MSNFQDSEETVSRVLELVSHLGGPSCTEDELKWAADIPAGKRLLDWLVGQFPDPTFTDRMAGSNHDPSPAHDVSGPIQTAVSPIALYSEEMEILDALKAEDSRVAAREPRGVSIPAAYELPSQLRARTKVLNAEAVLLERQGNRLKYRLNATKAMAKDLKHSIHALRKQIQDLDGSIQDQQQRLADFSAETDSGMAQHVDLASRALQDVIPASTSDSSNILDAYGADLASLSGSRAAAASVVKELYLTLDERYAFLPTVAQLEHDAAYVDAKLGDLTKDKSLSERLLQAAYVEELEKMAKMLEASPTGPDTIPNMIRTSARVLEPTEVETGRPPPTLKVDVKGELERAGRMDRRVLLKAQERGLDAVINYMRGQLIPRLQRTYDDLHSRGVAEVETEAIVSALIEELEDINDAVENAKRSSPDGIQEGPESLLEVEMIELLKALPCNDGNTPVLLNREDVEREVSVLSARLSTSRAADKKWAYQLRDRVRELFSSNAPLLAMAYANSAVNTSPPFAPSRDQVIVQTNTRAKAEELIDAAGRLQKDTELSSRDKRKLGAFTDKWVQSRN